jgi:threonylcarbamoyladenosine tRNA methylthiotransferase CDKAL1
LRIAKKSQWHYDEGKIDIMKIGMTNPPYMLDQLSSIAHFLNHPRVFSFIHIPIQAGHNNVLEKMNREYTVE